MSGIIWERKLLEKRPEVIGKREEFEQRLDATSELGTHIFQKLSCEHKHIEHNENGLHEEQREITCEHEPLDRINTSPAIRIHCAELVSKASEGRVGCERICKD